MENRAREKRRGLLLRADIHTLFDLDPRGIEPNTLEIILADELATSSDYKMFAGTKLACKPAARPDELALQLRFEKFQQANQL